MIEHGCWQERPWAWCILDALGVVFVEETGYEEEGHRLLRWLDVLLKRRQESTDARRSLSILLH